jgi:hypothetical protein
MVDLENIRSLQDHSGTLYAGAVLEWITQTQRDLEKVSPDDFEAHRQWAYENQVKHTISSKSDFELVLSWINDPDWNNTEAHDLYKQVRESDMH